MNLKIILFSVILIFLFSESHAQQSSKPVIQSIILKNDKMSPILAVSILFLIVIAPLFVTVWAVAQVVFKVSEKYQEWREGCLNRKKKNK
jgi:hypothetical protein